MKNKTLKREIPLLKFRPFWRQLQRICSTSKTMKSTSRDGDDDGVHSQFRAFVLADTEGASKALLKEVKERFQNQRFILNKFRKHMNNFTRRRIDVETLGVEVKKLFKGHDDLIHKYNAFLPSDYKINFNDNDEETVVDGGSNHDSRDDSVNDGGGVKKVLELAIDLVNKVKVRFQNEERVYEEFLEILVRIREERFWLHELKREVAKLFGKHMDLFKEFERCITDCREQKLMTRSIHDVDLSKCKQVSPSYWLLPDNCQTLLASHGSGVGAEVLNDNFLCVNAGTQSCSFKQRQRTRQEEILFTCEDDRFELDMLLERVNSASKKVEKLMIKIDDHIRDNEKSSKIEIKGHFSDIDLSCIERLYGDHGLDVIETLFKNPKTALPVILKSLEQKRDDLVKCRSDFNKVWAQVFAIYHYKLQQMQRGLKNLRREDSVAADQFKETQEKMQVPNSEIQLSVTN